MTVAMRDARQRRLLAEMGLVRYRLRRDGATNGEAERALVVSVPDALAAPAAGVAATVWSQVLRWLGLSAAQVRWVQAPDGDAIVLPPAATWSTPEGKRGLWLALKRFRRERG